MDIRDKTDPTKIKENGCESFKLMYADLKKLLKKKADKTIETDIAIINKKYDYLQDHYKHDLHHYFRFLYHMLKFIKQSEISESKKFKYSSILRATLSAYELVLIFYNGLHDNGNTHFKPLIEEFSFLKNIDNSVISNIKQKEEYNDLAFASSKQRELILKEWKTKRKN